MTGWPALLGRPARLRAELLAWYATHGRSLPWRGSGDPYAIWVSEVMLQQTQAAVVRRYYDRFLAAFPTVEALAAASLSDVLGLWSGLGYYSRARSLHAAAKGIAEQGRFPETLEELRALPGFGPYTAAAVGSIAFGLPQPAIDGNAVRVYARLFGMTATRAEAEPKLRERVRPLLTPETAGAVNQAIMDLGQLVCLPRAPRCLLCPWRSRCKARREGTAEQIPSKTPPAKRRPLLEACGVVRRGKRLLLARRRESGLFGGLWELPGCEQGEGPDPRALAEALERELGLCASIGREIASIDQTLTHRELRLVAFEAAAAGRPVSAPGGRYVEARFVDAGDLAKLGISSATRKLLSAVEAARHAVSVSWAVL